MHVTRLDSTQPLELLPWSVHHALVFGCRIVSSRSIQRIGILLTSPHHQRRVKTKASPILHNVLATRYHWQSGTRFDFGIAPHRRWRSMNQGLVCAPAEIFAIPDNRGCPCLQDISLRSDRLLACSSLPIVLWCKPRSRLARLDLSLPDLHTLFHFPSSSIAFHRQLIPVYVAILRLAVSKRGIRVMAELLPGENVKHRDHAHQGRLEVSSVRRRSCRFLLQLSTAQPDAGPETELRITSHTPL